MKITFVGATGQVTGSMYYIEYEGLKGLIDCGQFQGTLLEEQQNYDNLPFNASYLDFIILTHAHVDHSGRLPLLVKRGFQGKVFCTYPTMDLSNIMLRDSGKIHESENVLENKKRERAGLPKVQPLYTEEDAIEALIYLYPLEYNKTEDISDTFHFEFVDAGHLLGSASVIIHYTDDGIQKTMCFSGDLGNSTNPVQNPPAKIEKANIVIMESTYGDRLHLGIEKRMDHLVEIIQKADAENGTVIIPSFAVGRTQELIFFIKEFLETADDATKELMLRMPIYVDSPMALEAFKVYESDVKYLSPKIANYPGRPFSLPNLHLIETIEQSIMLNKSKEPKIIISASGMCDAGRIKHHLKHYLWRSNTHLVFIGYQANETLGRLIQDGEKTLNILDETIAVKANIHTISGFSGHADKNKLLDWVKAIQGVEKIFIIHGEPEVMEVFADNLSNHLEPSCEIIIPGPFETFQI